MKYFLLLVIVFISINNTYSQNVDYKRKLYEDFYKTAIKYKAPPLGYTQMKEDIDSLEEIIKNVWPQYEVAKNLFGYNPYDSISFYKAKVNEKTTIKEFVEIIESILNLLQDAHCCIVYPTYLKDFKTPLDYYFSIDKKTDKLARNNTFYFQYLLDKENIAKIYDLFFCYTNDHYYNIIPFLLNGKNIGFNYRVDSINGIETDKFVNQLVAHKSAMLFNLQKKEFYKEDFWSSTYLKKKDSLKFVFTDSTGKSVSSFINYNYFPLFEVFPHYGTLSPVVNYFGQNKVLYIRIPTMYGEKFYLDKINELISKKTEVNNIIIDIRENKGGDEWMWQKILKKFIKDTLVYHAKTVLNKNEFTRKFILNKLEEESTSEYIDFLDNKEFYVINMTDTLIPAESRLYYTGNIYTVFDEKAYSASAIYLHLMKHFHFPTIGIGAGRFSGKGVNPVMFILPNSKLIFQIEPILDITNVKILNDLFIMPEYTVNITNQYYFDRYSKTSEYLYSYDYLFYHDPFIKKAMELINASKHE